jgi:hypothetical protein
MQSQHLPSQTTELLAMLEQLNSRIARLSHALGADIRSEEGFTQILERKSAAFHTQVSATVAKRYRSAEQRTHGEWEELRGLLALRCQLMTQMIGNFGLEVTKDLASVAEAYLADHGFEPGADGLRLFRRIPGP